MSGEITLGVVSGARDGKPLVTVTPTRCSDPVAGEVYLGLVSGTHLGKPLVTISTQRCDGSGGLEVGQTYHGLVSGTRDGKLLVEVPCGSCDSNPVVCGCEICCTLEATVTFTGGPIDATLTCGGSFTITELHDCNEQAFPEEHHCVSAEIEFSGGEGSFVSGPKTWDWKTTIWISEEQDDGPTGRTGGVSFWTVTCTGRYKAYLTTTEYVIHEEGHDDITCCAYEFGILCEYTVDELFAMECAGLTGWGFLHRTGGPLSVGCASVHYEYSLCEYADNQCCPPGWDEVTPDGGIIEAVCEGAGSGVLSGCLFDSEQAAEPIAIVWGIEGCFSLSIADLCDEV